MNTVISQPSGAVRQAARSPKLLRLLVSSALIVGSAVALAASPDDPATPVAAASTSKWAPRKLNFTFTGFTTHYTCDGLQEQMKSILKKLGAGDDLVVKPRGCTRLDGPETFPGVEATFSVLEPIGNGSGSGKDAAPPKEVPAQWDKVTLDSDTFHRSNSGQCELIEQVKKSVLPLFTTRNLAYSSSCFPHTETLAGTRLSVEVLRPAKPAAPASPPS